MLKSSKSFSSDQLLIEYFIESLDIHVLSSNLVDISNGIIINRLLPKFVVRRYHCFRKQKE